MTTPSTNPWDDRMLTVLPVLITIMAFTMLFVAFGYRGLQ